MIDHKESLILKQTKLILNLMKQNLPPKEFKDKLDAIPKLKHQALKNALETTKLSKDSAAKNLPYLNSKTLEKGVGEVKKENSSHNPFYSSGSKNIGVSPGHQAKKSIKEGELETQKHRNTWFAKQGATAETAIVDDDDFSSDDSSDYSDHEDNLQYQQYSPTNQPKLFNRERGYSLSSDDSSDDESDISSNEGDSSVDSFDFLDETTLASESSGRRSPQYLGNRDEDIEYYDGKGEDVSEMLGTNLSHLYLDSERESPKIRILLENDKTSIVSKGLKNYKDYYEYQSEIERDRRFGREVKDPYISGFGKCFATSHLVADPDMNATNIGFITEGKNKIFARIDFGKALSYQEIVTSEQFENHLISLPPKAYSKRMFQGIDFAGEIESTISKFDKSDVEEVIGFTIKNLREAYGENFLNDPEIRDPLKRRMGVSIEEELTEELIKKRICNNMQNICTDLHNTAEKKMQEIFPIHPSAALNSYKDSMVNGKIDYGKFTSQLEKSGVDFKNPEHFNKSKAKETSNPMFIALIEAKAAIPSLPPLSTNQSSIANKRSKTIRGH